MKWRKFADKMEQTDRQTDVSKTETTLILSGYSRELVNIPNQFLENFP